MVPGSTTLRLELLEASRGFFPRVLKPDWRLNQRSFRLIGTWAGLSCASAGPESTLRVCSGLDRDPTRRSRPTAPSVSLGPGPVRPQLDAMRAAPQKGPSRASTGRPGRLQSWDMHKQTHAHAHTHTHTHTPGPVARERHPSTCQCNDTAARVSASNVKPTLNHLLSHDPGRQQAPGVPWIRP